MMIDFRWIWDDLIGNIHSFFVWQEIRFVSTSIYSYLFLQNLWMSSRLIWLCTIRPLGQVIGQHWFVIRVRIQFAWVPSISHSEDVDNRLRSSVYLPSLKREGEKRVCQYAVLHRSHLTVHLFFSNFNEWIIKKKNPRAMKTVFAPNKFLFQFRLCSFTQTDLSAIQSLREREREKRKVRKTKRQIKSNILSTTWCLPEKFNDNDDIALHPRPI